MLRLELDEELGAPESGLPDASRVMQEYDQTVFNSLPLGLRVYLTKYFLRDLTTLALYADAFIVHGELLTLLKRARAQNADPESSPALLAQASPTRADSPASLRARMPSSVRVRSRVADWVEG